MAQKKNTGKKSSGSSGAKKNPTGNKNKAGSTSASGKLDSVRGGSARQSNRAQEAARKAAGRTAGTSAAKAAKPAASAKADTAPRNNGKNKKNRDTPWQRMAIVAVVVLVCVVGAIQAVSCANSQIDSRQAVMVTLSDDIETTGIAIRNESIITSERQGVIVSAVSNGGKVSKGETVANIFNSADAARAYERMEEIEDALEQFESMATAGEESASEVTALQKAIREEMLGLSEMIYDGDAAGAADVSNELLYLLNKTQMATRIVDDFSDKQIKLETELAELQSRYPDQPGQLNSPLSGYYISQADGYESLLNTDICATLTPEKLDEIMTVRSEPGDSSIVGKIADDYIWYMACEVSAKDAERLAKNADGSFKAANYKLYLTYSELDSITARLVRVNTGADANRKILIFECSYMVSELSTVRIQPVTIELSSYSGLEVSANSIVTRETEVSASDIEDYDTEGRLALARALSPDIFDVDGVLLEETETEVSASDAISGSDVSGTDAFTSKPKESPYAQAARRLIESPGTPVNDIVKHLTLPKNVTVTQQGVYIVWGNEIKFKRISIVYQTGDKVLCEYNVDDGYLKMYDKVVDKPKGVYDGQIIHGRG